MIMRTLTSFLVVLLLLFSGGTLCCENEFQGFGIHLGSIEHFNSTEKSTIQNVIDRLYFDLKIRYFRTSYEPYFSPSPGIYTLTCNQPESQNCTWSWEAIMEILSDRQKYKDAKFIASVWTPPLYMMNLETRRLLPEKEQDYYYYLKNITNLIKYTYNVTIERISPVNEPENIWATWNHCNMDPAQLCKMVMTYNDSLISLCPENAYFWMTEIFLKYENHRMGIDCLKSCKTVATHAYALNSNSSSINYGLAYYDLSGYPNPFKHHHHPRPIWVTEVSSTYSYAEENQMTEALDFARNLVNFVGTTCVERYYFWSAFTLGPSGESLLWGKSDGDGVILPKSFWVFNHFTNASYRLGSNVKICNCRETKFVDYPGDCAFFFTAEDNSTVFINREERSLSLKAHAHCPCGLACTTRSSDLIFTRLNELPPKSVCSCVGNKSCHDQSVKKEAKIQKKVRSESERIGLLLQYLNFDMVAQYFV